MRIHPPPVFATALIAASIPPSLAQTGNRTGSSHNGQCPAEANLFLVSTLSALEGAYPIGLLKCQSNFGVSHYVGLGSELIALDGHFHHAYSTGLVEEAQNSEPMPFAARSYFESQKNVDVSGMTMAQLDACISKLIPSGNYFYAIKVHGLFSYVKLRVIPKQSQPYPTLDKAIPREVIFSGRTWKEQPW